MTREIHIELDGRIGLELVGDCGVQEKAEIEAVRARRLADAMMAIERGSTVVAERIEERLRGAGDAQAGMTVSVTTEGTGAGFGVMVTKAAAEGGRADRLRPDAVANAVADVLIAYLDETATRRGIWKPTVVVKTESRIREHGDGAGGAARSDGRRNLQLAVTIAILVVAGVVLWLAIS